MLQNYRGLMPQFVAVISLFLPLLPAVMPLLSRCFGRGAAAKKRALSEGSAVWYRARKAA
jgi:hypothetical protein